MEPNAGAAGTRFGVARAVHIDALRRSPSDLGRFVQNETNDANQHTPSTAQANGAKRPFAEDAAKVEK